MINAASLAYSQFQYILHVLVIVANLYILYISTALDRGMFSSNIHGVVPGTLTMK